jgi:hypothetical protein
MNSFKAEQPAPAELLRASVATTPQPATAEHRCPPRCRPHDHEGHDCGGEDCQGREPQPETAEQRRERLAVLMHNIGDDAPMSAACLSFAAAQYIADAIIVSDRVAGCDPEALRAEAADLRGALKLAKDGCQTGYTMAATYRAKRDAIAARLAVVMGAAEGLIGVALVGVAGDATAYEARERAIAALTNTPARAAALLQVVEAARHLIDNGHAAPGAWERLHDAVNSLDGEAPND